MKDSGQRDANEPRSSSRRRRGAVLLSWLAVVTSVAVLVTTTAGYLLVNSYDDNITRIEGGLDLPGRERPAAAKSKDAQTLLIVGSDSRASAEEGQGVQGTGEGLVTGQRADTIILAHLFGGTDQAQLVSIPRDSYVTIPPHVDAVTGQPVEAREGKINSSLMRGGPKLLVATVEALSGIRVDHYVQVDFQGFTTMVEQLGGVEVCLSEPAKEKDSGIDLPAGRQTIRGDQALAFVRQRKGLEQGDIDRIRRQQQFMAGIVRKTLSAGTLLNPLRLNGFLTAATGSLQVDSGTQLGDLRELALRMGGADAGGVVFTTLPVTEIAARRNGKSVVLLDEAAVDTLFSRLRRDVPPGAPDPVTDAPEPVEVDVPPADVAVQVYNGAGIEGLGRRVATDLEAVGFAMAGPVRNADGTARDTVVRHGPGLEDSARTLAAALPGAKVEFDPSLTSALEVVAGSSYRGAVPVRVAGSPAPPPPPAPPVPAVTAAEDVCAP